MARSVRKAGLETRTARLKMPVARKPLFIRIGPGLSLGYRRNQVAGTWLLRIADGKGGAITRAIGTADDFVEADGASVLNYWQAQDKAQSAARNPNGSSVAKPLTVRLAAEIYLEGLEAKNPRTARDTRGRLNLHFLNKFGDELVTTLTKSKLEGWLNTMALKSPDREAVRRSKDTANRVLSMIKALLNHALRDPANGITDDHAWRLVKPYHGVATPRATHFSEAQARALIEATPDREFAALLTAGFLTGARYGELIACSVRDFDETNRTLRRKDWPAHGHSAAGGSHLLQGRLWPASRGRTVAQAGRWSPLEPVASTTPHGEGSATRGSRSRRDVLHPSALIHFPRHRGGGSSEHNCGQLRDER
jgi:hypothetical protein